jgi:hypothetical protein
VGTEEVVHGGDGAVGRDHESSGASSELLHLWPSEDTLELWQVGCDHYRKILNDWYHETLNAVMV